MGELVPVGCYEVLPGDSIQQRSAALLRVSPLLAPVMHPVSVRIHHWFVPNRLIWDDWEDFITGGADGEDASVYPTITANFSAGALGDYLGVPPGVANSEVCALPFRAYSLIFNEFYRDQDLVTARVIDTTSGPDTTTDVTLAKIAWEKDYMTAARPWAQKGAEVTLPLGTTAPVVGDGVVPLWTDTTAGQPRNLGADASGNAQWVDPTSGNVSTVTGGPRRMQFDLSQAGLEADLSAATAVDVNTVRRAFAIQRYQEARALYGSRYTEYLRYLGVRSSDARLQRPEYLGGGKQTISFSEVLQAGPNFDANTGVGTLRGHGIAAMRSRRYRRFFEEHGWVISLMSVRPRSMYVNGLHRQWNRRTKEDFWQMELEKIGQQEVLDKEVYGYSAAVPGATFGYADRYSEYRSFPSGVSGEFRSTLNFWHLARIFASEPNLNSDFVQCDPSKRINAVQSADVLWCMVNHSIQARRMVSRNAVGRIL